MVSQNKSLARDSKSLLPRGGAHTPEYYFPCSSTLSPCRTFWSKPTDQWLCNRLNPTYGKPCPAPDSE